MIGKKYKITHLHPGDPEEALGEVITVSKIGMNDEWVESHEVFSDLSLWFTDQIAPVEFVQGLEDRAERGYERLRKASYRKHQAWVIDGSYADAPIWDEFEHLAYLQGLRDMRDAVLEH